MASTRLLALVPILVCAACAEGGSVETPASEVTLAANDHVMWFRSLPGFQAAATRPEAVNSGRALMAWTTESTYTLRFLPDGIPTSPERYALEEVGTLAIYQTGSGRNPSTIFRGGYHIDATRPDLFFTDRVSAGNSPSVGLYWGLRAVPGQNELGGEHRLFSLHVMMQPSAISTPRSVARAAYGDVTLSGGAPGELRTLTGTGFESGSDPSPVAVTFGGSAQDLLDGSSQGDGACNLTVDYTNAGSPTDARVFRGAANEDLLLAVDEDESDTASGLCCLVRKFDAPASPADPAQCIGVFVTGGHTCFVNPTNAGSDTFIGEIELSQGGAFRLDGVSHLGVDFAYTGTYTVADDGALTVTVNGTNETWHGAISRSYGTLVLLDATVENRANNTPELNLIYGIRKRTP